MEPRNKQISASTQPYEDSEMCHKEIKNLQHAAEIATMPAATLSQILELRRRSVNSCVPLSSGCSRKGRKGCSHLCSSGERPEDNKETRSCFPCSPQLIDRPTKDTRHTSSGQTTFYFPLDQQLNMAEL